MFHAIGTADQRMLATEKERKTNQQTQHVGPEILRSWWAKTL